MPAADAGPPATPSATGGTAPAEHASAFEQKLRNNNGFASRHRQPAPPAPPLSLGHGGTDRSRPVLLLLAGLAAVLAVIVLAKLGSEPVHVKGDIFEARPRRNIPEREKPTPAQQRARRTNIKKAQAARHARG